MQTHYLKNSAALLLTLLLPLGVSHAADGFPPFSWHQVPVYAHVGKTSDDFTAEQLDFLAKHFDFIAIEKSQAVRKRGSTEAGIAEAARQIKLRKLGAKVLFYWNAFLDIRSYLHILEWKPEGIEFNGIIGRPTKAYFPADPKRKALPVTYDANGRLTKIQVPATAPDSRNTVIAVEYDAPVVADPDAKGKYHWYTNRRTRHTDIRESASAGRQALPEAVTGD